MIDRRTFLRATSGVAIFGGLGRPYLACAQASDLQTLRFVPQTNLANPDPVWTTGPITRQHAYMVWDTLYGVDLALHPRPQMCAGHEVSDDGLTWTFKLRDGLLFHNNEKVRAADCVPSIERWAKRNGFGQRLLARLDQMKPVSDDIFQIRLTKPFAQMLYALGSQDCFIMPEATARTDAFKQITDYTGSGPFRFIKEEWISGAQAVYAKFDGYQPRSEQPDGLAGGKVVHLDRVEWRVIPDAATAAAALQRGEVDWVEEPLTDLLPILRKTAGIKVERLDQYGVTGALIFNHLYPPFNDARVRAAVLSAVSQRDALDAVVGDNSELRDDRPLGVFTAGTPLANDTDVSLMGGAARIAAARQRIAAAGFAKARIVVLDAADIDTVHAMSQVMVDLLRQLDFTVDYQPTDSGTWQSRRALKNPPSNGGWNCFVTVFLGLINSDPASSNVMRANGADAWFGWPTDPKVEDLRAAWFDAKDLAAQRAIGDQLQAEMLEQAQFVPLCQWYRATAMRTSVVGALPGQNKVFWNVRKV